MSTSETIDHLRLRLAELTVELVDKQLKIDLLTQEHDALKLALESLEKLQDNVLENAIGDGDADSLTYRQRAVFEKIPIGKENAFAPVTIGRRCPSLDADYVRKTLSRMARAGRIGSENGKYWRES